MAITEQKLHEARQLLGLARHRLDYVPKMHPFRYSDSLKQKAVMFLTRCFFPNFESAGFDNLQAALSQLATKKAEFSKKPSDQQTAYPTLMLISNHLSDADHSYRRMVLEAAGFQTVADQTFYPTGFKMHERWFIRPFMPAENLVWVFTPYDLANIKKVLDYPDQYGINGVDLQDLEQYRNLAQTWNKNLKPVLAQARKKGLFFSPYPEATRSRTGQISPAYRETSGIYPRNNVIIVPLIIDGLQEIFPPGQNFTLKPTNNTYLGIGQSFTSEQIWQKIVPDKANYVVAHLARTAEAYKKFHLIPQGPSDQIGTADYYRSLLLNT